MDTKRKLDISTIFAPTVAVIKVQFRLLGFPWEMEAGEARMEAVLVGRLGLTLDLVLVLAREREDGQWRQVLLHSGDRGELDVEDEEADKVLADPTNLTMVFEVSQEMKERASAFSRAETVSVYRSNYVTTSFLPGQYKSSTSTLQPLTPGRIRQELLVSQWFGD